MSTSSENPLLSPPLHRLGITFLLRSLLVFVTFLPYLPTWAPDFDPPHPTAPRCAPKPTMAPHPDNPRLPIWHTGVASQTPGSAAPVAGDEPDYHAVSKPLVTVYMSLPTGLDSLSSVTDSQAPQQQTSLGFMPGEIDFQYQSPSHRSQPSPQPGQAIRSAGFGDYQVLYTPIPIYCFYQGSITNEQSSRTTQVRPWQYLTTQVKVILLWETQALA